VDIVFREHLFWLWCIKKVLTAAAYFPRLYPFHPPEHFPEINKISFPCKEGSVYPHNYRIEPCFYTISVDKYLPKTEIGKFLMQPFYCQLYTHFCVNAGSLSPELWITAAPNQAFLPAADPYWWLIYELFADLPMSIENSMECG
jgi:hypothetical protein